MTTAPEAEPSDFGDRGPPSGAAFGQPGTWTYFTNSSSVSLLAPPTSSSETSPHSPGSSGSSKSELSLEYSKTMQELEFLSHEMGMPVRQENGQRRFGPPLNCSIVPPKGCEIFVGKIPRDCYENELVPIFSNVGNIYEMRLMMDFSGTNRGYCFVQYYHPSHAREACNQLNHYEIRKGRFIGVTKSVDNCRLFIGGIPKTKTEEEIFKEIARCTEGVVRVFSYSSPVDKKKNRGFAFIEYTNHRAAAMARRKLLPGKTLMWGVSVCVDWAEPEPDDTVVLYVRKLHRETSDQFLFEAFNAVSDNGVFDVKKYKHTAFIEFYTREQAENAKAGMHGGTIDGCRVDVSWWKPVDKSKYKRQVRVQGHEIPLPEISMGPFGGQNGQLCQHQNQNGFGSGELFRPHNFNRQRSPFSNPMEIYQPNTPQTSSNWSLAGFPRNDGNQENINIAQPAYTRMDTHQPSARSPFAAPNCLYDLNGTLCKFVPLYNGSPPGPSYCAGQNCYPCFNPSQYTASNPDLLAPFILEGR